MRAVKEALNKLKTNVAKTASRKQKMVGGQGTPGTRAGSIQTGDNDAVIGVRVDFGEKLTKEDGKEYQRLKLQANKGAKDPTLKDMANKNPHKVWSEADVPIGEDSGDSNDKFEQVFEDLIINLKDE
ncbi:MAG: hypothetical protein M1812_007690 [Candelaria pacifica]|nr:MAG: hypothetical protein M1812_007690 [Candelaria pacifica]